MGNTRYSLRLNTSQPVHSLHGFSWPTRAVNGAGSKRQPVQSLTATRAVTAPLSPVSLRARAAKCATLAPRTKKRRAAKLTAEHWPRRLDETLHQKMRRMVRVGLTVGASPANVARSESWAHQSQPAVHSQPMHNANRDHTAGRLRTSENA